MPTAWETMFIASIRSRRHPEPHQRRRAGEAVLHGLQLRADRQRGRPLRGVHLERAARRCGAPNASPGSRPMVNVYVRDLAQSVTTRVSARPRMAPFPTDPVTTPAISGDGRWRSPTSRMRAIWFATTGITGRHLLVRRQDADHGAGQPQARPARSANGASTRPAMSTAGTILTFQSDASDMTCTRRCPPAARDINLVADIFAFNRRTRLVRRVSTGRAE